MSDKKEWGGEPLNTSKNAVTDKTQPGLPVNIPLSIVRWLAYSFLFGFLLAPFNKFIGVYCCVCGAVILGHFASQLNALIKKP